MILSVLYISPARFRTTPQTGLARTPGWCEFAAYLSRPTIGEGKDQAGAYSPALYRGNVRRKASLVHVDALVLDVDQGGDVDVFDKLREDPDDWPSPVEYTVTDGRFAAVDTPAEDTRPLEERIIDRLGLAVQTKNGLRTALGRNSADIETALSNLFAARRISSTTVSVRGKACKAFALRQAAAPNSVGQTQ